MKLSALIVDDSRLACKVMSNMLESLNIESVAVYSGEEAIDYLKHSQPSIIFLDHSMPGMNGLQAITIIKSNPLTATIPVLMYTAKEGDVYVGQARALGALDVLPKGLEKNDLLSSLTDLGLVDIESLDDASEVDINQELSLADELTAASDDMTHKHNTLRFELPIKCESDNIETSEGEVSSTSELETVWKSRIYPYLKHQKLTQSNDFISSTDIQTRKLTKEFYRILEEFECVFAQRLDSRDDFLEAQKEQAERKRHKQRRTWFVTFCLFQAVFLWQIMESNYYEKIALKKQQEYSSLQAETTAKFNQLNEKIDAIGMRINNGDQPSRGNLLSQETRRSKRGFIANESLVPNENLIPNGNLLSNGTVSSGSKPSHLPNNTISQIEVAEQSSTNNELTSSRLNAIFDSGNNSADTVKLVLTDNDGQIITPLIPLDASRGQYIGTTSMGYQFEVNAKGGLKSLPKTQYFQTYDCTGDRFIESDNAMLYRDDAGELWYVDKYSSQLETTVSSKSTEGGGCEKLNNIVVSVRSLQQDLAFETGLDLSNGLRVLMN